MSTNNKSITLYQPLLWHLRVDFLIKQLMNQVFFSQCVWQHSWPPFCMLMCVHRGSTGWGRTLRWGATACGGKTGTTMMQSKEMPLDLVGPNLLRVPQSPSSSTLSYRDVDRQLDDLYIMCAVFTVVQKSNILKKDSHIYTLVSRLTALLTHHPILWALLLSSSAAAV